MGISLDGGFVYMSDNEILESITKHKVWQAGFDAGVKAGREESNDWTPCADGLPKKVDKRLWSRDVLATIKQKTGNCFVVVAYYHYGHEQWKTDDMTDNDAIDVLAWQPLPAPYNPDHIRDATKKVED